MVDFSLLKKLIEMVKTEDISGLSIEEGGTKYEIKRERGGIVSAHAPVHHSSPTPTPVPTPHAPKEDDGLVAITSPMVGVFYASPSPDAAPFVKTGDHVSAGKVVCIIEAMKLFNEIESEVTGSIVKILAENGKPVEYGQKLMLVKKG